MALRCMTHVLYRQTSVNFFNKKFQAGIRALSLYSCILAARQFTTMASNYIPVEKGTPNSTDYRIYFSEYWQYQLCVHLIFLVNFFFSFVRSSLFAHDFRSLSQMREREREWEQKIAKRQKTHIFIYHQIPITVHRVSYCQQYNVHCIDYYIRMFRIQQNRGQKKTSDDSLTYQCVFISYFAMTLLTYVQRRSRKSTKQATRRTMKKKNKSNTISMPHIYYDSTLYMHTPCVFHLCGRRRCFCIGVWLEFLDFTFVWVHHWVMRF